MKNQSGERLATKERLAEDWRKTEEGLTFYVEEAITKIRKVIQSIDELLLPTRDQPFHAKYAFAKQTFVKLLDITELCEMAETRLDFFFINIYYH